MVGRREERRKQYATVLLAGEIRGLQIAKEETENEEFTFWCYLKLDCILCWFLFLQMFLVCVLCFPCDFLLTLQPAQIMTFKVKEKAGMCFNAVQILVKDACSQVFFHKHESQRLGKITFTIPLFIECIDYFFLLIPALFVKCMLASYLIEYKVLKECTD